MFNLLPNINYISSAHCSQCFPRCINLYFTGWKWLIYQTNGGIGEPRELYCKGWMFYNIIIIVVSMWSSSPGRETRILNDAHPVLRFTVRPFGGVRVQSNLNYNYYTATACESNEFGDVGSEGRRILLNSLPSSVTTAVVALMTKKWNLP